MNYQIDPLQANDWPAVKSIYQEGIADGNATFETTLPDWPAWNAKYRPDCRLVVRQAGQVIAWAAVSPVSKRHVYRGVAEVSIYVARASRGQGVGKKLLGALIEASEQAGIWTLQAGIFPENETSIALHQQHGFRILGRRERIGCLKGIWRDVILMERRSQHVGVI